MIDASIGATLPASAATALLGGALAAPWLALALLGVPITRSWAMRLMPWAALPALLAALLVPSGAVLSGSGPPTEVGFGMDPVARAFLLPAALLWGLAGWFADRWIAGAERRALFAGFWLAAMAGNLGLILAQDLLAFYTCFALMTFAAYGLVIHEGTDRALRAGRLYLAMMVVGETCLFTAVALAAVSAVGPRLEFAGMAGTPLAMALFAAGFGMKLGVLGLHGWLPVAHPVAPVPASAVLGGAMIKAGLLGWWRVASPESAELTAWGLPLVGLGLAAAFYGIFMGLPERDPKTVLAWSSISQMGLATLLAGVAVLEPRAGPVAWTGLAVLVLHHGLAKGALFLGVGVMATAGGSSRRLAWVILWWPALALAGAPGTSGALAKTALDLAVAQTVHGSWIGPALSLGAVATTLLMARFLYLAWTIQPDPRPEGERGIWEAWGVLIVLLLGVPWFWSVERIVAQAFSLDAIAAALWPPALGLLLAGVAWRLWPRLPRRPGWPARVPGTRPRGRAFPALPLALSRLEQRLHRWPVVGRTVMIVTLLLVAALWRANA